MVKTRAETGVTVVTICNYDEYQGERDTGETPQETPVETGARQGRDTEQRREEDKNQGEDSLFPEKPKVRRPAKELTALPDDFTPALTPDARKDWNALADPERALREFKDHALTTGRTTKDWQAAFRTWLGKAVKYQARDKANGRRNANGSTGGDGRSTLARVIDDARDGLDWMDRGHS